MAFRKIFDEETARSMSEPEDQDFYGIGSRSTRWTTNLVITIVFSSISPLISLLGLINFFICRAWYPGGGGKMGVLTVLSSACFDEQRSSRGTAEEGVSAGPLSSNSEPGHHILRRTRTCPVLAPKMHPQIGPSHTIMNSPSQGTATSSPSRRRGSRISAEPSGCRSCGTSSSAFSSTPS